MWGCVGVTLGKCRSHGEVDLLLCIGDRSGVAFGEGLGLQLEPRRLAKGALLYGPRSPPPPPCAQWDLLPL